MNQNTKKKQNISQKEHTLKGQLGLLSMIGYIAVVCVLIILDYGLIYSHNTNIEASNIAALESYVNNVDTAMRTIDETTFSFYNESEDFQTLSYTDNDKIKFNNVYKLMEQASEQMKMKTDLTGVIFLYNKGESRRYLFSESVDFNTKIEIVRQVYEKITQPESVKEGFLVCSDENAYYVYEMERKNATVACVTKLSGMDLDNLSYQNRKIILTYGQIVLTNQELAKTLEISGNEINEKNKKIQTTTKIYIEKLKKMNIGVYLVVINDYSRSFDPLHILLIVITVFVVIIVFVLYRFLNHQILNPLKDMTNSMILIREGKKKARLELAGPYQELKEINTAFNSMMDEIEQLKISSYEEQIEKQNAQMQCFQLQLRPHFYLNCLKSLNSMVISNDTENMQELILTISKQLRYLLKNEAKLVTVGEELENVKGYLELQKLISSRKVECDIQIDKGALSEQIPILLIHTFVENTFKHAVLPEDETVLRLKIKGILLQTENGNMLDITIEDNGIGYPKDILDIINSSEQRSDDGVAIGIMNVKQRCRLLYRESAEYMFYNMPGAVSEVVIPLYLQSNQ